MSALNRYLWLCFLLVFSSHKALAWGKQGHEIVAAIAFHYLTPEAKQNVNLLLSSELNESPRQTFIDASNWADSLRDSDRYTTKEQYVKTNSWHYINIPISSNSSHRYCSICEERYSSNSGCITKKINEFISILQNTDTPLDLSRSDALKFLIHFIGDLHQPLHVSNDNDAGGNEKAIFAIGLGESNLHHLWDTQIVKTLGTNTWAITEDLIKTHSPDQINKWQVGSPCAWTIDSFNIGKNFIYKNLSIQKVVDGTYQLDSSYMVQSKAIVRTQLSKAGIRLAATLNKIFKVDHQSISK